MTTPQPTGPPTTGGRRAGAALVAVFLAAQLTTLIVSVLVLTLGSADAADLTNGMVVVLLVVPTTAGALIAVLGVARFGHGPRTGRVRRELAVRWSGRDLAIGSAFGVGGLLLTLPAAAAWAAWVGEDRASSAVGDVFAGRALGPTAAVFTFLAVWLVAPLAEEVLFRGVLWRALEHWGWNRWVVFAVTSLVFSIAHAELLRTPLLLVLSIPIGLARLVTGNLLASVIAHQANNFLPAVGLLLLTTAG